VSAGDATSAAATKGKAIGQGDEVRHDLADGDYQIIVHVIEARDLTPVDTDNNTADPVVVAKLEFPSSVIPAYQNTDRKVNTLNPVWDYTMIFRQSEVPVRRTAHTLQQTLLLARWLPAHGTGPSQRGWPPAER